MSGIGGFRGVSASQDARFSNKQKKLLKSMKFPREYELKVDGSKVKWPVLREWVAKRVTDLLGLEDEVLIQFIQNRLEGGEVPDPRELHIDMVPFLEKNTSLFMKELWAMLSSASETASGIPQQILDEKAAELQKKKELQDKISEAIRKQRDRDMAPEENGVRHRQQPRSRDRHRSPSRERIQRRNDRTDYRRPPPRGRRPGQGWRRDAGNDWRDYRARDRRPRDRDFRRRLSRSRSPNKRFHGRPDRRMASRSPSQGPKRNAKNGQSRSPPRPRRLSPRRRPRSRTPDKHRSRSRSPLVEKQRHSSPNQTGADLAASPVPNPDNKHTNKEPPSTASPRSNPNRQDHLDQPGSPRSPISDHNVRRRHSNTGNARTAPRVPVEDRHRQDRKEPPPHPRSDREGREYTESEDRHRNQQLFKEDGQQNATTRNLRGDVGDRVRYPQVSLRSRVEVHQRLPFPDSPEAERKARKRHMGDFEGGHAQKHWRLSTGDRDGSLDASSASDGEEAGRKLKRKEKERRERKDKKHKKHKSRKDKKHKKEKKRSWHASPAGSSGQSEGGHVNDPVEDKKIEEEARKRALESMKRKRA